MYVILFQVETQTDLPQGRQCGTWSVSGKDELSHLGYQQSLVGYCPSHSAASGRDMQGCRVSILFH